MAMFTPAQKPRGLARMIFIARGTSIGLSSGARAGISPHPMRIRRSRKAGPRLDALARLATPGPGCYDPLTPEATTSERFGMDSNETRLSDEAGVARLI